MRNFSSTLLHWEEAYRAALLERDRDMLVERISEARLAIIERVKRSSPSPMTGAPGNVRRAQGPAGAVCRM